MKQKIQKKDLQSSLEAINRFGFDKAFEVAFDGSITLIAGDPEATLPTTFLAWSYNLALDAKDPKTTKERLDYLLLSHFYRKLAHKLYWNQRRLDQIAYISDFIQLVK